MSDFIAEYRPQAVRFPPIQPPSGFVAEVRRSSREPPSPGQASLPEMNIKHDFFKGNAHSEYEGAFNEVLSQKVVSKETLREVTKKSIVTLLQTLLSSYRVTKIQGYINVSTVVSDETLRLELNEQFQVKRNPHVCHDVAHLNDGLKFKVDRSKCARASMDEESMCCPENPDAVDFRKYLDPYPSRVAVPMEATSGRTLEDKGYMSPSTELNAENNLNELLPRRRRDSEGSDKTENSEEESGYSSNGRDSVSDESGEEMADDGVNASSQLQQTPPCGERIESCQDVHSEDADCGEECGLVIDLSVPSAESYNVEQAGTAEGTDKAKEIYTKPKLWALLDTKSDEGEKCFEIKPDLRQPVGRDETMPFCRSVSIVDGSERHVERLNYDCGLEVPMDLSGDKIQGIVPEWKEQEKHAPDTTSISAELSCKKCPTLLPDIYSYKEHALQFHQLHVCVTCFNDFSSKNNLKRHVRIHTGSRPYKCGQCEQSFARRDDLKGHTLRHDYNKPFRCSLCRKGYTDRACVKNHMLKEHCSRLMQICPECGESFDRDDVFLEHKKSHPSLQQFACDTCQYIGTNHLMALKHKLLHSYKLFSCKPCNAYFADPFGYTKHVRKHKKTPEFTFYVCCFCDSVLPTYDQYVRHEYSHAQGKLHECNVCKKQFKSKTSMIEHSYVHSDPMTSATPETVTTDRVGVTEIDCNENDFASSPSPDLYKTSSEHQVCQSLLMSHTMSPPRDKIGNGQDPIEDNLIDLCLKPQSSEVSRPKEFLCVDKTERTPVVLDISSPRTLSLSNPCVPRNGCAAIETHVHEQGKSVHDRGSVVSQTNSDDEKCKIVWHSPAYYNNVPTEERENVSERCEKNRRSILTYHEMQRESKSEATILEETERKQIDRKDIRFHPYSRHFASKFVAARASKLLKEIGNMQTGTLKNESTATAVASMTISQAFLKARGQRRVSTSGDTFQKSSPGDEAKLVQPTPLNTPLIIGLTGKPCLARCSVEEPINYDDKTKNNCPAVKSELMDDDSTPTSISDLATQSGVMEGHHTPIHSSSPFSEDQNECGICHTNFQSFFHLESHSVNEHKRYLCEHCKRSFTARPNRDRHLRYHTGERPYKCDLCPSAFMRGDDLKNHRTSKHRTEQVNCDKCLASFAWQKDLEKHKRHSKCGV